MSDLTGAQSRDAVRVQGAFMQPFDSTDFRETVVRSTLDAELVSEPVTRLYSREACSCVYFLTPECGYRFDGSQMNMNRGGRDT